VGPEKAGGQCDESVRVLHTDSRVSRVPHLTTRTRARGLETSDEASWVLGSARPRTDSTMARRCGGGTPEHRTLKKTVDMRTKPTYRTSEALTGPTLCRSSLPARLLHREIAIDHSQDLSRSPSTWPQ